MKTRLLFCATIIFVLFFQQHAYGIMEKVRIEQLIVRSNTIVTGRVVDIRSIFADSGNKEIVTLVTVTTADVLKGIAGPSIVLTIPGGIVGTLGLWVEDTPHFKVGEEVLLFVNDDFKGRKTVAEWRQGKFPIINGSTFIEGIEASVANVIEGIRTFVAKGETGTVRLQRQKPNVVAPEGGMAVPSISYISPATAAAIRPYSVNPNDPFNPGDRGTIIDLYGSGFGSTQGTSIVRFYENQFSSPPVIADVEDVILWSDTRITCKIPGRQFTTTFLNASSGPVYVITSGGTSNGVQFTVTFAAPSKRFLNLPVSFYINENGTPDCDGEFQAIQNSFQTWEDVSFSNLDYTYAGTTTRVPSTTQRDFYNDCIWLESNWPFPSTAIGVNFYWFNGDPFANEIYEFDIFFNGQGFLWTTTGETGRQDVQNLATHESGHSLNLQDIYGNADAEKTMYGYSPAGGGETKKRTLEADDIGGCRYIYPDSYSLSLFNTFQFDGTSGGQVTVKNVSQGTNTVAYSAPQNRTVYHGTTFEFGALSQQTVNGRDYRFQRWTDYAYALTRTVTVGSALSLSPIYKGHLLAGNQAVSATNGQRKIVRDESGTYHVVYSDENLIYYTFSTDNGTTWSTEEILPYPNMYPKTYPTITSHLGYLFVVWQEYEGVVTGKHQYRMKAVWKLVGGLWKQMLSYGSSSSPLIARFASPADPLPTLVAADNTFNEHSQGFPIHPELMCAWRNEDGIYSALGNWDVIPSCCSEGEDETLSQEYVWTPYVRFGRISSTSGFDVNPSLGTDFLSRVGLAYDNAGIIYAMLNDGAGWSAREQVSIPELTVEPSHDPSATFDNSSRMIVSWKSEDWMFGGQDIEVRRRETSGGWNPITMFGGIPIGNPDPFHSYYPSVSG